MPWTAGTPRPQLGRAAHQLTIDATLSDERIAELAGCSRNTVAEARSRLERLHIIPVIPPAARARAPYPRYVPPSRTAEAIERLGPDATPRQVADAAQVSLQAAWKMLRKTRPALADAAAATDALSVSKMPRQLADSAAAADVISVVVTVTCTNCGQPFSVSTRNTRRRFCTQRCSDAAAEAQGHAPKHRLADPSHPFPAIRELPRPPDWSRGTCAHVPRSQQSWWTSSDPVLREAAAHLCVTCPILKPCAEFSLALPVTDNAVWAGMSQTERLRRKRDAGLAAAPKPSPRTGLP